MDFKFEKWQDFNNISVKVSIKRKMYDAILIVEQDKLILRINMTKDINEWRNSHKNFDILKGTFLFNNQKIFFINCVFTGHSSHFNCQTGKTENVTSDYIIDRLILDKNLTISSLNSLKKYSASYKNLDLFTEYAPMMSTLSTFNYDENTRSFRIQTPSYSLIIYFYCRMTENRLSFSIDRFSHVEFEHNRNISIKKAIENIYTFRNFLMIILKHPLYVQKQTIYIDDNAVELFDCRTNEYYQENADLEEKLFHRSLKIEKIDNIEVIYNNFIDNYQILYPIIELYYNVTQFKVPNLTRFVSATTMLENYSRNYNYSAALALSKSKNPKSYDANFIDMVICLINNVNECYNYSPAEIEKIAENIKEARIYYIHYKTRQASKPLTNDQQFSYSYFIQDIILLNIYKLLGMDISKYEYVSLNEFYYDKYDLL